jgi:hypothetical protein
MKNTGGLFIVWNITKMLNDEFLYCFTYKGVGDFI